MNWCIRMLREDGKNPCGSDYTFIETGLKTLRGVKNRMKKWEHVRGDVVKIEIYTYLDFYRDDTFRLIDTIEIPKSNKFSRSIAEYIY